ncbi:MAG: sulfur oxidation c-type cytochrome SoxX [Rhodobacterales bacterium]|nr:MAG: sulfur oxidation c-type cytochrome SoxX [Rhodobacterales bacterium]
MKFTTLTCAAMLSASAAFAGSVSPAEVVFNEGAVEASLSGAAGNVEAGKEVYASKKLGNCVACHKIGALPDVPFPGNVGPELDGVGDRWSVAEIRGILTDSKQTFEGTVMPAYYKVDGFTRPGKGYTGKAADDTFAPLLTAQQIEDVVAFLATLKE